MIRARLGGLVARGAGEHVSLDDADGTQLRRGGLIPCESRRLVTPRSSACATNGPTLTAGIRSPNADG
jgi:hypothetical protein